MLGKCRDFVCDFLHTEDNGIRTRALMEILANFYSCLPCANEVMEEKVASEEKVGVDARMWG
jgi:hypothetical protein